MDLRNIISWSKMPLKQRYNVLIALVVVTLCGVIVHYEKKVNINAENHRTVINNIITRYTNREAVLEARLEVCNQNYLLYLQKSEKEYKELLFQAKKLEENLDDKIEKK